MAGVVCLIMMTAVAQQNTPKMSSRAWMNMAALYDIASSNGIMGDSRLAA